MAEVAICRLRFRFIAEGFRNARRWLCCEVSHDRPRALVQPSIAVVDSVEFDVHPVSIRFLLVFADGAYGFNAKLLFPGRIQRTHKDPLHRELCVVVPVVSAASARQANVLPVCSTIARTTESVLVNKGLDQDGFVSEPLVPIVC